MESVLDLTFWGSLLGIFDSDQYLQYRAPSILLQEDHSASVRTVVNHRVIVIPAAKSVKMKNFTILRGLSQISSYYCANECAFQRSPHFIFDKL